MYSNSTATKNTGVSCECVIHLYCGLILLNIQFFFFCVTHVMSVITECNNYSLCEWNASEWEIRAVAQIMLYFVIFQVLVYGLVKEIVQTGADCPLPRHRAVCIIRPTSSTTSKKSSNSFRNYKINQCCERNSFVSISLDTRKPPAQINPHP